MEENGFYKKEYFDSINNRLDTIEKKIDGLTNKVNYIYAFSAGISMVVGIIFNVVMK